MAKCTLALGQWKTKQVMERVQEEWRIPFCVKYKDQGPVCRGWSSTAECTPTPGRRTSQPTSTPSGCRPPPGRQLGTPRPRWVSANIFYTLTNIFPAQSGSEWSMSWRTARMNNTVQFTLGEEFEEKGFGGKVVKVQIHFYCYP